MYEQRNREESEFERDALLQSMLAYWSSGPHRDPVPDPLRWEDGRPDLSRFAHWAMFLASAGLVVLTLWWHGL